MIKGGKCMILDAHIHIGEGDVKHNELLNNMHKAQVDGGCLLSIQPNSFKNKGKGLCTEERLDNLFKWTAGEKNLFPFFWIDPLEEDALQQVALAVQMGVVGFKVICNRFYPNEDRPMEVFKAIAAADKPILFHSGILYSSSPSSLYNRPAFFESLMFVQGIRFALAHISWPWCDECIAVYGHFDYTKHTGTNPGSEMFIDFTPGTPPSYRKDAITNVMTAVGKNYDNILFGVDNMANDYNSDYALSIMARDNDIFASLCVDEDVKSKYYEKNLKRFLGIQA